MFIIHNKHEKTFAACSMPKNKIGHLSSCNGGKFSYNKAFNSLLQYRLLQCQPRLKLTLASVNYERKSTSNCHKFPLLFLLFSPSFPKYETTHLKKRTHQYVKLRFQIFLPRQRKLDDRLDLFK